MDIESLRVMALQTLGGGMLGTAAGAMAAHLRGQPVAFMASAYGTNSLIFSAFFLATRAGLLSALPQSLLVHERERRQAASALAGAISGGALTAFVAGPRRGLIGAAVWGACALVGQTAIDGVAAWRSSQQMAVAERNALWAALTTAQRLEFTTLAIPFQSQAPVKEGQVRIVEVPPVSALPALRDFARSAAGVTYADVLPAPLAAAVRAEAAASDAAAAASAASADAWSWLPVKMGAGADEARLAKLKARLASVEELLGLRAPPPPTVVLPGTPGPTGGAGATSSSSSVGQLR